MSERIARRAARHAALGVTDTRGTRFAQARAGLTGPQFTDLAAVPRWLMLDPDQQERVAKAVGLMRHRVAIDRELSGPRLAMLADVVGEDLLDAVCAAETDAAPVSDGPLLRPDLIVAEGWAIMHAGLPAVFAARYPDARGNPAARAQCERAVDIVAAL